LLDANTAWSSLPRVSGNISLKDPTLDIERLSIELDSPVHTLRMRPIRGGPRTVCPGSISKRAEPKGEGKSESEISSSMVLGSKWSSTIRTIQISKSLSLTLRAQRALSHYTSNHHQFQPSYLLLGEHGFQPSHLLPSHLLPRYLLPSHQLPSEHQFQPGCLAPREY
jgi:hypothetical protein